MSIDDSKVYDLLDRLAGEFSDRLRRGERPTLKEYADRYPELADEIAEVFPALVTMEQVEEICQDSDDREAPAPPLSQVGDYRIIRQVGQGGMGIVYEAEQVSLGRRVALKVLPLHGARDPTALERFRREARASARLHHTNIVPVFEVGQDGEVRYYAMQFIQGQNLDAVIAELRRLGGLPGQQRERGREETHIADRVGGEGEGEALAAAGLAGSLLTGKFGPEPTAGNAGDTTIDLSAFPAASGLAASAAHSSSAVLPGGAQLSAAGSQHRAFHRGVAQIGRQVASALAYAHARGIVHRDIKPSNVLLDTEGVAWVTDFGLARLDDSDLTSTGDLLGTLRYMAPERFRGRGDARSDIYALGLTVYELLTLRPAFNSRDRGELAEQIRETEPPRPRAIDSRIPCDLETIVLKAIEKEPGARYATAELMAEDLRRFLANEPIQARRVTAPERYLRWARRNPVIATLGGVLTALLVGVTIASVIVAGRMAALARDNEAAARSEHEANLTARKALAQAEADRNESNRANVRLQTTQEELRETLYATRANLALAAWETTDMGRLRFLLDLMQPRPGEPERRGWEGDYLNRLAHQEQRTFREHNREVSQAVFSPDGQTIASVQWGGLVKLWDPGTGCVRLTLDPPQPAILGPRQAGVSALAFSPDGRRLAGPGPEGSLGIWEAATGRLLRSFQANRFGTQTVAFSPDGRMLATGAAASEVKIWDPADGRLLYEFPNARGFPVSKVLFSPDGQTLASTGDGSIRLWDVSARRLRAALTSAAGEVHGVAFSPDGRTLASGGSDRVVRLWDVATGRESAQLWGHAGMNRSLAFSPDGRRLASAGLDAVVRLWDVDSHRSLSTLKGHTDRIDSVAFSPDGRTIVSCGADWTVRLWDADRPSPPLVFRSASLPSLYSSSFCVAFSPDSRWVAAAYTDRTVRVWDVATGQVRWTLTGHKQSVLYVAFSPDGRRLVSSDHDQTIRIWDVATGQELLTLKGHGAWVRSVAFSPDGRCIASASDDGTIMVWGDPAAHRG